MPFFVTNFSDKLSIYPKRTTEAPQLFPKLALFRFMLMQLNDIRVPLAISPRERYAWSPKLGKSTLL